MITIVRRALNGAALFLNDRVEARDRNPVLDFTVPRSATWRPGIAAGASFFG
jgi:hypothetical protein